MPQGNIKISAVFVGSTLFLMLMLMLVLGAYDFGAILLRQVHQGAGDTGPSTAAKIAGTPYRYCPAGSSRRELQALNKGKQPGLPSVSRLARSWNAIPACFLTKS